MATPFPNHPQLRGNYAPINFEAQIQDLVVEGSIPEDLSGSLYRNGPNPKYAPTGPIIGLAVMAWCTRSILTRAALII